MTIESTEAAPMNAWEFAARYLNATLVHADTKTAARLVDSLAPGHEAQLCAAFAEFTRELHRAAAPDKHLSLFATTYPETPVVPIVNVTVEPAPVTVLPTEPKTRVIERDDAGEIVKVHEE